MNHQNRDVINIGGTLIIDYKVFTHNYLAIVYQTFLKSMMRLTSASAIFGGHVIIIVRGASVSETTVGESMQIKGGPVMPVCGGGRNDHLEIRTL